MTYLDAHFMTHLGASRTGHNNSFSRDVFDMSWEENVHDNTMPRLSPALHKEALSAAKDMQVVASVSYTIWRRWIRRVVDDAVICRVHGLD